ncbi:exonuclease V isoform X1 [Phyllobates terribilis]|uniref:exonuclease V isoform X1 n=2 Tax=Phyllobates terribilis TaxID=111132 RepID=UPI003CCA89DE
MSGSGNYTAPPVTEADAAGRADRAPCEENEDSFSDISDSELLQLQDAAEIGDRHLQDEKSKNMEDGRTSLESVFVNEEGTHKDGKGGNISMVQRKRKTEVVTPLEKYSFRYVTVTDVCSQVWCEQQMVYKMEHPGIVKPERAAAMSEGSSIHLARELEVHDVVTVATQTREDSWAIKFLNILAMIPVLQSGGRVREFPVFRELDGIFLVGVIDELGYSSKGELELRELKTRVSPTLPTSAQKRSHKIQVSLYKLLFDGMVSGGLQPDVFLQHLKLRPEQNLGPQVKEHAIKSGLTVSTFRDVLELTCLNLTYSDLPTIDSLKLEYCFQGDNSLLGSDEVTFEKEKILEEVTFYFSYWKGLREVQGIDIEDAWKCRRCEYSSICEWRARKTKGFAFQTLNKRFK